MATPVISGTTRTNLGPLTTNSWTYTCTEVIQECSDCDNGWAAQTCIDGVVTDNQECWPPRATNVPKTSGALDAWGVYSPGIVCPGGYTSVATAIQYINYHYLYGVSPYYLSEIQGTILSMRLRHVLDSMLLVSIANCCC